jgi:hypothetical protein
MLQKMKDYSKAVIRNQPHDLTEYSYQYFKDLYHIEKANQIGISQEIDEFEKPPETKISN